MATWDDDDAGSGCTAWSLPRRKPLQRYRCAACGFEAHHYFWQCPGCQGWDTYPPRRMEALVSDAAGERVVLCMKWGTKYGPEYVNRLYGMVRRHLSGEFRFVCLTDDASGVRAEVQCLPLPTLDLPPGADRGWPKLTTFKADLHGLRGRALFVDLDIVIVGSHRCLLRAARRVPHHPRLEAALARDRQLLRLPLPHRRACDVLQRFIDDQAERARSATATNRNTCPHAMHEQGKLAYWPEGWCRSFKYHCLPRWPLNHWRAPAIPAGTRILIFHGEINPPDALAGRNNGNWRAAKPAPWIAEHWLE